MNDERMKPDETDSRFAGPVFFKNRRRVDRRANRRVGELRFEILRERA